MPGYVALLRDPFAARPFVASVIGRIPIATVPLGLVLLVRELRDSYTLAGIVTGVFAVGLAVGSPFWGRALDRLGHPRVITTTACTSAAVLVLLTIATAVPAVPPAVLIVLSVLVGATFPPMSPAMRATWRIVVPDEERRRRGYALDAVAVETIFVGGPLLLSGLLLFTPSVVPLLVTAVLLAGGCIAYSRTRAARTRVPHPGATGPGRADGRSGDGGFGVIGSPGIPMMLTVMGSMSIGFGLLDVSLAGLAEELLGSADKLGVMFAGIAGGSAVGGLLYGSRNWRSPDRARLPFSLSGFGILLSVVALYASADATLWILVPLLFCAGLFISPNLIAAQGLVDELAPAHRLGEAQAWLSTSITAGAALGNAAAGVLIDTGGPQVSLATAAGAILLAAGLAVGAQRHWRRSAAAGLTRVG